MSTEDGAIQYRFFNLRAIVSLPRNIFIDTPTLTSLIFAQKKTSAEVQQWDAEWSRARETVEAKRKSASSALAKKFAAENTAEDVSRIFLKEMSPVLRPSQWVSKGGKNPALKPMEPDWAGKTGSDAAAYYRDMICAAGFSSLCEFYIFDQVATALDYQYPAFEVDEIGYKLSKRRERARPNQLASFRGAKSKEPVTNLHLAGEECEVVINASGSQNVLDEIRKASIWSEA